MAGVKTPDPTTRPRGKTSVRACGIFGVLPQTPGMFPDRSDRVAGLRGHGGVDELF